MTVINWVIVFLAGGAFVGILLYSLLHQLKHSFLDRAVAYHTRNMDDELDHLLGNDK